MSEALALLDAAEVAQLDRFEERIQQGLASFIEVGEALSAIRERRLYRATHGTFEDYCRVKWGMSRQRAHQFVDAASAVSTIVDKSSITTESQARELSKVEPSQRAAVVEKAIHATGGKITAAALREAAKPDTVEVVIEMSSSKRTQIDPHRFSQAMLHADNACASIDKIPFGDPQIRAALSRIQQHIEARLKKDTK